MCNISSGHVSNIEGIETNDILEEYGYFLTRAAKTLAFPSARF